mmetsp:Transcript_47152/g.135076  ORF Transcript_47152/g.135076 Transcript_47152/m.135076 type:complete len:382 (+) Transcript_47152:637-1782(+)
MQLDAFAALVVFKGPHMHQFQVPDEIRKPNSQLLHELNDHIVCETLAHVSSDVAGLQFEPNRRLQCELKQRIQSFGRKKAVHDNESVGAAMILLPCQREVEVIVDGAANCRQGGKVDQRAVNQADVFPVARLEESPVIRVGIKRSIQRSVDDADVSFHEAPEAMRKLALQDQVRKLLHVVRQLRHAHEEVLQTRQGAQALALGLRANTRPAEVDHQCHLFGVEQRKSLRVTGFSARGCLHDGVERVEPVQGPVGKLSTLRHPRAKVSTIPSRGARTQPRSASLRDRRVQTLLQHCSQALRRQGPSARVRAVCQTTDFGGPGKGGRRGCGGGLKCIQLLPHCRQGGHGFGEPGYAVALGGAIRSDGLVGLGGAFRNFGLLGA